MPQILFKNLNLLDPRWNEARGGYEVLVEGDTINEVSSKPIKAAKAPGHRLRQAHPDAGPDRLPCPCLPERGQYPQPRARAADPDDGARRPS